MRSRDFMAPEEVRNRYGWMFLPIPVLLILSAAQVAFLQIYSNESPWFEWEDWNMTYSDFSPLPKLPHSSAFWLGLTCVLISVSYRIFGPTFSGEQLWMSVKKMSLLTSIIRISFWSSMLFGIVYYREREMLDNSGYDAYFQSEGYSYYYTESFWLPLIKICIVSFLLFFGVGIAKYLWIFLASIGKQKEKFHTIFFGIKAQLVLAAIAGVAASAVKVIDKIDLHDKGFAVASTLLELPTRFEASDATVIAAGGFIERGDGSRIFLFGLIKESANYGAWRFLFVVAFIAHLATSYIFASRSIRKTQMSPSFVSAKQQHMKHALLFGVGWLISFTVLVIYERNVSLLLNTPFIFATSLLGARLAGYRHQVNVMPVPGLGAS